MSTNDILNQAMTAGEVVELYGFSEGAVRKAIRDNRIPARRSGGTWLVSRADVYELWGQPQLVMRVMQYTDKFGDREEDVRGAYGHTFETVEEALAYLERYGGTVDVLPANDDLADDDYYPATFAEMLPVIDTLAVDRPFSALDGDDEFDPERFGDFSADDYEDADALLNDLVDLARQNGTATEESIQYWAAKLRDDERRVVARWLDANRSGGED